MNIFATSPNPYLSAERLDDKRCIKMVLESAQMLSTALNESGSEGPYKSTHVNHPCNIWVRQHRSHYVWLLKHFNGLCDEYTRRYGKTHKCEQYFDLFVDGIDFITDLGADSNPPNCAANKSLGICYKHIENVFEAYKQYLEHRWSTDKRQPTWYKKPKPELYSPLGKVLNS